MEQKQTHDLEERAMELIDKDPEIVKAMMQELLAQADCYQLFMVNALDEIDLNNAANGRVNFQVERQNLRQAVEAMTLDKLLIQYVALKKLYESIHQEEKPADFRKCDACGLMVSDVIDYIPTNRVAPYKICNKCADVLRRDTENLAHSLRETGHTEEEIRKRVAKITRDFVHQPPLEQEKNNG